jgi:hypothetical protein
MQELLAENAAGDGGELLDHGRIAGGGGGDQGTVEGGVDG